MAIVVLQVVAFGFEDIVVLVFRFSARLSCGHNGFNGGLVNGVIGDERVAMENLSLCLVDDSQLTPIDEQCVVTIAQRRMTYVTASPNLTELSIPSSHRELFDIRFQEVKPLIKRSMRIWLADQDEAQAFLQEQFTKRLVAVEIVTQHGDFGGLAPLAVSANPTLGGCDLTILLLIPILGQNKLRLQ